jgi:hypothetical protein
MDWVLAVVVLALVVMLTQYYFRRRDLQKLQPQYQGEMLAFQNTRAQMQALINDCMEYSKSNPSIDPILESVGLKASRNGTKPPSTSK